jgi:hypothetical protein
MSWPVRPRDVTRAYAMPRRSARQKGGKVIDDLSSPYE